MPQPKSNLGHFSLNMTSGGNNFNHFADNQLTKFSARDAGDFSDAAGERETAPKCGSLPRDAGDLVGLLQAQTPSVFLHA